MAYFFATLFVRHPEFRPMFPLALDAHRQRVFAALARYAWSSDRPESLTEWLSELAREHRKFGVAEGHFEPFCDALLVALRSFGDGPAAAATHAAWQGALDHIASVMTDAVHDAGDEPAWWLAEVTGHERRAPGVAVVTLRPDQPLPYLAGQHVSIQVPRWPRLWREYSVANPPGPEGLLTLHVRAVPCGLVSTALVHHTRPGDTVVAGPARGVMTAAAAAGRDGAAAPAAGAGGIACFAGGTGLAPIKAIVTELTGAGHGPPVGGIRLFVGARREEGLYDAADLDRLAEAHPALTVIPVVSDDPGFGGLHGTLAEAAGCLLPPDTADVFISGPPGMVRATAEAAAARAPAATIHFDPPPSPARHTPAPAGAAGHPRRPHLVPWRSPG
jgi:NAD(P)H-flavin reductase